MQDDKKDVKAPEVKVDIPDYPNWRRGMLAGLLCGLPVFAIVCMVPKADLQLAGACAIIAYLAVGGIVAFRPVK